jgi:predicted metal-dependent peptidase
MAKPYRTAEERIQRAHLQIMKHPDFCVWAGLIFVGKWTITDHPTAAVKRNGDTQYGRAFVDSISCGVGVDAQLNFLVLHEKGHVALMHTTRAQPLFKKNYRCAAIAIDQVVNNLIVDTDPTGAFAHMPVYADGQHAGQPIGCLDRRFKGMALKEVFDILVAEQGSDDGNNDTFDDHEFEEGDDPQQTQAIEIEVGDALRSGAYMASKLGGKQARALVGELNEPQVKWEEQMAEFVMDVCQGEGNATWRKPLRRFIGEDIYMPSSVDEMLGDIVYALDVSASISDGAMHACLTEGVELCRAVRPSLFRLLYWDVGVVREEIYTPDLYDQIVALTRPAGGGGTDVRPVAQYVNSLKDVQCCVIATDGDLYGGWGEWEVPTLWAITTKKVAPVGKTIHLKVK